MPQTVFSKRDCPLVWKLVEYTFNNWIYLCKDVRCERSKQTVTVSQDRYKIPSCLSNLLRDEQSTYMLTSTRFSKQIICEGIYF